MVTIEDALTHLGIDYADKAVTANVRAALDAAEYRMLGAVGYKVREFLPEDPRVDQLVRIYLTENYDERSASMKTGNARSRLATDLELQLRLELRAAQDQAGGGSA